MAGEGIDSYVLTKEHDDRTKAGIRVGTMHRIKGLEFESVIIALATQEEYSRLDEKLKYVAATRAKRSVYITGVVTN